MKRVLIWGTGNMARRLLKNSVGANIVGFIQSKRNISYFENYPVIEPSEIPSNIDYILVANTYTDEIYDVCTNVGVDLSKVIFLFRGRKSEYCGSKELENILGEANYTLYKSEYGILEDTFFKHDMVAYNKLNSRPNFAIDEKCLWPILEDKYATAGVMNNYFWQDLWAARHIIKSGTRKHFDIGSRLDGFIAHLLAADIDVTVIDVREFPGEIDGLYTIVDDATYLNQFENESIESMSALCSLEHFGLGRYGDPIDPEACFKCFRNIQRVLKKGGNLYISVPVGRERVEFNAHRVFYASTIIDCIDGLKLVEYSTTAEGRIEYDVDIHKHDNDPNNGEYRYGLFHFVKQ